MLKACCDCIFGAQQSDNQYNVRMNGESTSPPAPWQTTNEINGKMFTVPTQLRNEDSITIKGQMVNGGINISLRPDSNQYNIVCEFNVDNQNDEILLSRIQNGIKETVHQLPSAASQYFIDSEFNIRFMLFEGDINIFVDETPLESVKLTHSFDNIRYISVVGNVSELIFKFNISE